MQKLLLLTTVLFIALECTAQQDGGLMERRALLNTPEVEHVTGMQETFQDSTSRMANRIERVYSEKQWKLFRDSLSRLPAANMPPFHDTLRRGREVSEEEFVRTVNRQFSLTTDDPLKDTSVRQNLSKEQADKELYQALPATDLGHLTLPSHTLQDLSPLTGNVVNSEYLQSLDSLRAINLKEERLKLDEKRTSALGKVSEVRKSAGFLDRFYFEGILGISGSDFKVMQLSPSFGYHLSRDISVGVGPSILIREAQSKTTTSVGARSFVKVEFLQGKVYLQAEDVMGSYTSGVAPEKKKIFGQHHLFVGGGYLLSLSSPVTLNLAVLYNISHNTFSTHEFSPWVFRIGISIIKPKDR